MESYSAFLARSGFFAPKFCATKADMESMMEIGTSIMKAQTFSATPTPADAVTPRELTIARMIRNERLTMKS